MEFEVEVSRPRVRPKGRGERLCKKITRHIIRMEDAMDQLVDGRS